MTDSTEKPTGTAVAPAATAPEVAEAAGPPPAEMEPTAALPPVDHKELEGTLIVLEGTDGSGRSTQIALLTEWLESQGFAVETMGLRRSLLIAKNIDDLMARNAVTRYTLALMYATDFFDQLENRIIPALRSGMVVLADRYLYTLVARAVVRGIDRDYLEAIYSLALRPNLTFFLNVRPEVAFTREFKKNPAISYWEAGRDMSLSADLYESFLKYQTMLRKEFVHMGKRHRFVTIDGEASIRVVNAELRRHIAAQLGIRSTRYRPSTALAHLWQ